MFIVYQRSGDTFSYVNEYTLSSPFNVSTASYAGDSERCFLDNTGGDTDFGPKTRVFGIDFSEDGSGLRGEAKKIYKITDVIKMNNQSYSSFSNYNNSHHTDTKKVKSKISLLQIYANEKFSLNEFKAINLQKGNHKINIIVENQRLALPDLYQVNTNLIEKIRSINGVKEVSFDE